MCECVGAGLCSKFYCAFFSFSDAPKTRFSSSECEYWQFKALKCDTETAAAHHSHLFSILIFTHSKNLISLQKKQGNKERRNESCMSDVYIVRSVYLRWSNTMNENMPNRTLVGRLYIYINIYIYTATSFSSIR